MVNIEDGQQVRVVNPNLIRFDQVGTVKVFRQISYLVTFGDGAEQRYFEGEIEAVL